MALRGLSHRFEDGKKQLRFPSEGPARDRCCAVPWTEGVPGGGGTSRQAEYGADPGQSANSDQLGFYGLERNGRGLSRRSNHTNTRRSGRASFVGGDGYGDDSTAGGVRPCSHTSEFRCGTEVPNYCVPVLSERIAE